MASFPNSEIKQIEETPKNFILVRNKPELCEFRIELIFNLLKSLNEGENYLDVRKESGLPNSNGR